jgi:hypothetical protein
VLAVAVAVGGGPARAQGGDAAAADALFRRGLGDLDAGRVAAACNAFEESYALDPQLGALFTLAECFARLGRVASAVTRYQDFERAASKLPPGRRRQQRERERVAREQLQRLGPRVPTLTVVAPPDLPPAAVVARGDVPLGPSSLGHPLPVDPGEYAITLRMPSGAVASRTVRIEPGQAQTVTLEAPPEPPPPRATAPAPARPPVVATTPAAPSKQRTWAIGAGALGLAGLAAGGVTGLLVVTKKDLIGRECGDDRVCSRRGKEAADSAQTLAAVSTAAFAVGAAGLAAGAALWLSAPAAPAPKRGATPPRWGVALAPGPGHLFVGVEGSFR